MSLSASPSRRQLFGLLAWSVSAACLPGSTPAAWAGDDGSGSKDRDGGQSTHCQSDITIHHPDGWTERIVDGSYELFDPQDRLVVRRCATTEDFNRLVALR